MKIPVNCTGCTACVSICPKGCFILSKNREGFSIPLFHPQDCIDCGLCENACQCINPSAFTSSKTILAAQSENEDYLQNSSSGGIFSEIAISILNKNGIVYGAAIDYDNNLEIRHIRVDNIDNLAKLRGSKYVQSNLTNIFPLIKKDLQNNLKVLFTGTPCQVLGLKRYLRKDYDNLITIDFICHGVPSPLAWEKYIMEIDEKFKGISNISFRDKRTGWDSYGFSFKNKNPRKEEYLYFERYKNPFMRGFLYDLYLRQSCHKCPVKNFFSGADLTLGDAWGIENYSHMLNIEKGVSLVVINSEKGITTIEELKLKKQLISEEIIKNHNSSAYFSSKPHKNRKKFFKLLSKGESFESIIDKCIVPPTYLEKILWSIKRRLKIT